MINCLQCKKELKQTSGKRAKKFCGPTCRSNYWYARNKRPTRKPKSETTKDTQKERSSQKEAPKATKTVFMNDAIKKKLGIK